MESVIIDSGTLAGVILVVNNIASFVANLLPNPEGKNSVTRFFVRAVNFLAANVRVNSIK